MSRLYLLTFLFASTALFSFVIGNPSQPSFNTEGLISSESAPLSFRAAYLDDYVYTQHFIGQFSPNLDQKPPVAQCSTNAALLTCNLFRSVDLYGIVGSAQMQIDEEVFGQRELAWGIGTKVVMYRGRSICLGCDFKYFQTEQTPLFLVSGGFPLDVATPFNLRYTEYQGAIGLSYQTSFLCPYIQGTYLSAKLEPTPHVFLVRVPGSDDKMDASISSFIGKDRWGMAVGATLIMGSRGSLAIESRFFNQNAIDVSLEVRF
jgi:hypothetical protein